MGGVGRARGRRVYDVHFGDLEDGEKKVRRDVLMLGVDAGFDDLQNVDAFLLK